MVEPRQSDDTPQKDSGPQVASSTRDCPTCAEPLHTNLTACPRDGTVLENPLQQEPKFKHKYEFLATIGSGGMGVVYKARHIAIDKIVAIKMLHSHLESDAAFARFQREAKAASLLSNKYIIAVHDLGATIQDSRF